MHELSVAEQLLARASEAAADHGSDTVETLTVELGVATHVNPTQLRLCLETVAETRGYPDLTVEIESVDPQATCECGWAGEPPSFEATAGWVPTARCPDCGSSVEFTSGKECRLASITVPDAPECNEGVHT